MTPDLFCRIGEALYGANWKGAMADDLDVSPRTVQRWGGGQYTVPDDVESFLGHLMEARQLTLTELRNILKPGEN